MNLLLAINVDGGEHPNAAKFAEECHGLCDQLYRDGLVNKFVVDEEIKRIKAHACKALVNIDKKKAALDNLRREILKKWAMDDDEEVDELTP